MGRKAMDLAGKRFGRLTVLERFGSAGKNSAWLCECDCGNLRKVAAQSLYGGGTIGCGCQNGKGIKHGLEGSREYVSWKSMRARCTYSTHVSYANYGGRGITVCDRWSDFASFYADMGPRPEGTSIDRIDVNGNYEPGNCRWATPTEQARNKRRGF